jgi:sugar O-acyltransferase (sialic acid O-acetyltransferase NeuD family)
VTSKKLLIFGTGEIGRLAHFYFTHDSHWDVVGFVCDDEFFEEKEILSLPCIPVSKLNTFSPTKFAMHVALSYKNLNLNRKEKYLYAKEMGYDTPSYISSKATVWSQDIGDNCFILEDQTIQPDVKIGHNVVLWSGNHLGHGTSIADHVYIASHAVISGHCSIGERTFIGVNAAMKDFTEIGEECFIGMGVNITRHCKKGSIVLPEKVTILENENPLAARIKKKYFGGF